MADIALGSLERVLSVVGKIKEAVKTVRQNKEECGDIANTVARVTDLLSWLKERPEAMEHSALSGSLEDLAGTLDHAFKIVTKCQRKRYISHLWSAADTAKELSRVHDDISRKLVLCTFATNVQNTIILARVQYTGAPPLPTQPYPQRTTEELTTKVDAEVLKISQSGHSTGGARSEVVNSEKEKTMVATISGVLSDPLSGITQFSLSQLKAATNDFSGDSVVGSGGFSVVYKGVLRDGRDVAIKKLLISNDFPERRLHHELNIGAKLQHKNIVKLLGYCLDTKVEERLYFLVQEYVPNGSLERIINASRLDWPSCFQIVQGIARGVHYLHEQRILYMDLKPANILFDSDMNPVIIDFGLSLVLDGDDDQIICDALAGTLGYIAPEKITQADVSMKSDVFSFGVILIEIITGKRVSPASDLLEGGSIEMIRTMNGLFDPALVDESLLNEINRCIKIGLMCVEWDPKDRPTMADVLELLNS